VVVVFLDKDCSKQNITSPNNTTRGSPLYTVYLLY
jgi:hypothetical protein